MSVSISSIKSTLGVSANSLKALCQSSNINKFSATKPGSTGYNSSGFTFNAPSSNFKMSSFNGYNHSASCAFKPTTSSGNIANSSGSGTVTFTTKYEVGSGCVNLYNVVGSGWRIAYKIGSSYYYGTSFGSSTSQSLSASVYFSSAGSYTVETYLNNGNSYIKLPVSNITVTVTKTYTPPSISLISTVYDTTSRIVTFTVKFYAGSNSVTFTDCQGQVHSRTQGYVDLSKDFVNSISVSANDAVTKTFTMQGNMNIGSWTCNSFFVAYVSKVAYTASGTVSVHD